MKKQINLMPNEMTVSSKTLSISSNLNKSFFMFLVIFLISGILLTAGFLYYSNEYRKEQTLASSIKNQILALEKNEQKLVLAKNRLQKISTVRKSNISIQQTPVFKYILDVFSKSEESTLTELNLTSKKTELSFTSKSSIAMSNIIKSISSLGLFSTFTITSITYNSTLGYVTNLLLNTK